MLGSIVDMQERLATPVESKQRNCPVLAVGLAVIYREWGILAGLTPERYVPLRFSEVDPFRD